MLKHITVDPFANPCSPYSCRSRFCVYFTPRISSSNSKTKFQIANFHKYELTGCMNPFACFPVEYFPYPSVNSGNTGTIDAPQQERVQHSKMEHTVWKNADVLIGLANFVGKDFLFFGGVSRAWRSAWGNRPAETIAIAAHTSVAQMLYSLECGLHLEAELCADAARFGRRVLQR